MEVPIGSKALLNSSQSDVWNKPISRAPWPLDTSNVHQSRSTDNSPARYGTFQSPTNVLPPEATHFPQSFQQRPSLLGGKRMKGSTDLGLGFTFPRSSDHVGSTFGPFGRSSEESNRAQEFDGSWNDAGSVQSPLEDQQYLMNLGAFGAPVTGNGSLPSSRHGTDNASSVEAQGRYSTNAFTRGTSSYQPSPALSRAVIDENYQQSLDGLGLAMGSMSLSGYQEQPSFHHRAKSSMSGVIAPPASNQYGFQKTNFMSMQQTANTTMPSFNQSGSSFQQSVLNPSRGPSPPYRGTLTPNSVEFRPASQLGQHSNTPPMYATLYRPDILRSVSHPSPPSSSNQFQNVQQDQLSQPSTQSPLNTFVPSLYRNQYNHTPFVTTPLATTNFTPYSNLSPNLPAGQAMPGASTNSYFNVAHFPNQSRDSAAPSGLRSHLLEEFRNSNKNTKRYVLKVGTHQSSLDALRHDH